MSTERGNLIIQRGDKSKSLQQFVKRVFDFVAAALGLIVLSPLFAILIVLIRVTTTGPALFRQRRIGQGGEQFEIIKFRTMHQEADLDLPDFFDMRPETRLTWGTYQKLLYDPRLTRLGRLLRRSSLDELPQLINVLSGEMSLVGPRPILPEQVDIYGSGFSDYVQMRPGMTGLWQTSGRNRLSFEERAELDGAYIRNWSLIADGKILARTLTAVIFADGAY